MCGEGSSKGSPRIPSSPSGYKSLSDEEVRKLKSTSSSLRSPLDSNSSRHFARQLADLVLSQKIKDHTLEKILNPSRAVQVRRIVFSKTLSDQTAIESIPSEPR